MTNDVQDAKVRFVRAVYLLLRQSGAPYLPPRPKEARRYSVTVKHLAADLTLDIDSTSGPMLRIVTSGRSGASVHPRWTWAGATERVNADPERARRLTSVTRRYLAAMHITTHSARASNE